MKFYSTKDASRKAFSTAEAAAAGIAPDGGLYVPEQIPQADLEKVKELAKISYAEMATYLASLFFDDIDADKLSEIVHDAYNFPVELKNIGGNLNTLELFHGPTCTFKDFGARMMGRLTGLLNNGSQTVITATSGGNGSAVANGFYGVPGVNVVLLYPDGNTSPLHEAQMTTLGGNIIPLCVRGNFDDCQALARKMIEDKVLRNAKKITSANSYNILSWIPETFYFFYGWCKWSEATGRTTPDIVVPCGNYSNLAAVLMAKRMGLPVDRIIAATNANNVIPEYLRTGIYAPHASTKTLASAMDVGAPANYERIMWLCNNEFKTLSSEVVGFSCSDDDILANIKEEFEKYGYLSDPHSAIGYAAAKALQADGFWISTAHNAKFRNVVEMVLPGEVRGQRGEKTIPEQLKKLDGLRKRYTIIGADGDELRALLLKL